MHCVSLAKAKDVQVCIPCAAACGKRRARRPPATSKVQTEAVSHASRAVVLRWSEVAEVRRAWCRVEAVELNMAEGIEQFEALTPDVDQLVIPGMAMTDQQLHVPATESRQAMSSDRGGNS